jgi:hypothetical protein
MTAYRNSWFLYRMISSLIASFSSARSKIIISLIIISVFRNRACIRRNNRAEEGIFINIRFIGDNNLSRTIINKTLLRLNK